MAETDHRKAAENWAELSMTGEYVNEAYPQRLVTLAQVHAILTVADAIQGLIDTVNARCGRP